MKPRRGLGSLMGNNKLHFHPDAQLSVGCPQSLWDSHNGRGGTFWPGAEVTSS